MKHESIYRISNKIQINCNVLSNERAAFVASFKTEEQSQSIDFIPTFFAELNAELSEIRFSANDIIGIRIYSIIEELNLGQINHWLNDNGYKIAVSLIRQEPLATDCDILIQGQCIKTKTVNKNKGLNEDILKVFPEASSCSWTEGGKNYIQISGLRAPSQSDSFQETEYVFQQINIILNRWKLPARDKILRTWLYVKEIDDNYHGAVEARKKWFEDSNVFDRYFVSTGIGTASTDDRILSLDILICLEHQAKDNVFIDALDLLPHAASYGVTFERALHYQNKTMNHCLIAGTASIDQKGEILYKDNPPAQSERIFLIIEELLNGCNMNSQEMEVLTVYLRDEKMISQVVEKCKQYAKELPILFLRAPVCRPGWLIEIEGEASNLKAN